MSDDTATLVINPTDSYCAACGKGADPSQETHDIVLSYAPAKPEACHRRFTRVRSDYNGTAIKAAVIAMRPDLEWVGFDD